MRLTETHTDTPERRPGPGRRAMRHALLVSLGAVAVVAMLAACGGGKSKATPTEEPSETPAETPTAVHAGLLQPIAISPGDFLTPEDLAARGKGTPGRGEFA